MKSIKQRHGGFSLIELLTVVAILVLVLGILFPAIQLARESARRVNCSNQQRQLALAAQLYEQQRARLPEALVWYRDPLMLIHWQAACLPFLEQANLAIEVQEAFRSGLHPWEQEHRRTVIPNLQCSSNPDVGLLVKPDKGGIFAFTDYCGVAGVALLFSDGVFVDSRERSGRKGIGFREITDGLSNTLMFGERPPSDVDEGIGSWLGSQWICCSTIGILETAETIGSNRVLREVCDNPEFGGFQPGIRGSRCSWIHHWSFHPQGANFARVDGSIHFIPYATNKATLSALATRAGDETVSVSD